MICPTKYIDSNTWHHFRQRIKVDDLKKFLTREIGLLEEALAEANNQIKLTEKDQNSYAARDEKIAKASDIVNEQLKFMIQCREDAHILIAELLKREKKARAAAEGAKADEEMKKAEEERAEAMGAKTIADKIRIKPADMRLPHEKEFVSYDMLLHPEHYINVSEVDEETYKFDPAYNTTLTKEDLQRIVVLPEPLNLAMSFLKNETELKAHQCLQKILFERGEDRLKERMLMLKCNKKKRLKWHRCRSKLKIAKAEHARSDTCKTERRSDGRRNGVAEMGF